jgi:hypothetical protein
MAVLVLNGLRLHLKEKLEGFEFLTVGQILQRALAQENRGNESRDTHRMNQGRVNIIENHIDSDVEVDVYTTEFVWPKAKPYTCNDMELVHKTHDEEFNVDLIYANAIKYLMPY